jgi:homoserine/homoserine lactone efflux protein
MLITSVSLRRGIRAGVTAVAGSSTAVVIHLSVVVAGLASVVTLVGEWFEWVRWIGAGYLIFLGLRAWLTKSSRRREPAANGSAAGDFGRGLVVTLTNPKTLFFLGAFLPQFVDPDLPAVQQLVALALTFLVVSAVLDSGWALLAGSIGTSLRSPRFDRLRDRITGTILIAAGTALALARRQ